MIDIRQITALGIGAVLGLIGIKLYDHVDKPKTYTLKKITGFGIHLERNSDIIYIPISKLNYIKQNNNNFIIVMDNNKYHVYLSYGFELYKELMELVESS